jgi:Ca2+-binding EF-hand superfamily protein
MSGFFKKYLGKRVRSTTAEKKIKEKNAFDKRELAALEATYSDLASRSNLGEANIDKDNFLKFFNNVPGMLGERLFQVFDTEHTHNVSFAEFRSGLFSLFRGTQEDRLRFIFSMFAMKTDKTVDRQDLTTMLNSVLFVGLTDTDSREELDAKVAGLVDSG